MNDPQSHSHAGGCGCSKPATNPAPAAAPSSCCGGGSAAPAPVEHHHAKPAGCCSGGKAGDAGEVVKDPVCGMMVDPAKTAHHAEHDGHAFHFCSAGCRPKLIAAPDAFLGAHAGHHHGDAAATVTDPVCGMTVDPAKTAHHAEHAGHEYYFCSGDHGFAVQILFIFLQPTHFSGLPRTS